LSLGIPESVVAARQNYCGVMFAKKCGECQYHVAGSICPGGRVWTEGNVGAKPGYVACGEFVRKKNE